MKEQRNKKIIVLFMTLVLSIGTILTGCGGKETPSGEAVPSEAAPSEEAQEPADGEEAQEPEEEKTFVYGLASAWTSLMPYSQSAGGYYSGLVADKIFDKLVVTRSDGTVTPRAAKSWELSADGLSLTLYLDENSKWHDGEPVTAQDWVWTFQALSKPEIVNSDKANFDVLTGVDASGNEESENSIGVEATDDYTLVLHFKEAQDLTHFFFSRSKNYIVLPKHLLQDVPLESFLEDEFWLSPVGSGPCIFESEVTGSELVLKANPDYQLGAPDFDTLIIRVVDPSNMLTSLSTGELDYAYPYLSTEEALSMEGNEAVTVTKSDDPLQLYAVWISNVKVSDSKLRLAIDYAVDKELICQSLFDGDAVPSTNYITPTSSYFNQAVAHGRDVEKAKALLAESSYGGETLVLSAPAGIRADMAVIIQQNLEEAGIHTEIISTDTTTMFADLRANTLDMGIGTYGTSLDPLCLDTFFDSTKTTFINCTDPAFLEKQKGILAEQDQDKKLQLIYDYQVYMEEYSPFISVCHTYSYVINSSRVSSFNGMDTSRYNDCVWEWKVN